MGPSLGEAKRAALANMKPPKDNLLWQFDFQEKLKLQEKEIEKLRHLPQDMVRLQERLDSIATLQQDILSGFAKSNTATNLQEEHMVMAEEIERLATRVDKIEKVMKTYVDNNVQTSKIISDFARENEMLHQRVNAFEAEVSRPTKNQSIPVSARVQQSPARKLTVKKPGPGGQSSSVWRRNTSPDPMSTIGGQQSVPSNSQSQSGVLRSFESMASASNSSQDNPEAASMSARVDNSSDIPKGMALSGQTASSLQAPPGSPLHSTASTGHANRSQNTAEAPASHARQGNTQNNKIYVDGEVSASTTKQKAARIFETHVENDKEASEAPQRLLQGDKSLIQYFEDTGKSIREAILITREAEDQITRNWMNGLADRGLFKDLQKAIIGIAKNRDTEQILWEDVEMVIWLPSLEGGMYWAKKRELELERETYHQKQRVKARAMLNRNLNDEPSAPSATERKRKM